MRLDSHECHLLIMCVSLRRYTKDERVQTLRFTSMERIPPRVGLSSRPVTHLAITDKSIWITQRVQSKSFIKRVRIAFTMISLCLPVDTLWLTRRGCPAGWVAALRGCLVLHYNMYIKLIKTSDSVTYRPIVRSRVMFSFSPSTTIIILS
jgi:hypothetical protein